MFESPDSSRQDLRSGMAMRIPPTLIPRRKIANWAIPGILNYVWGLQVFKNESNGGKPQQLIMGFGSNIARGRNCLKS